MCMCVCLVSLPVCVCVSPLPQHHFPRLSLSLSRQTPPPARLLPSFPLCAITLLATATMMALKERPTCHNCPRTSVPHFSHRKAQSTTVTLELGFVRLPPTCLSQRRGGPLPTKKGAWGAHVQWSCSSTLLEFVHSPTLHPPTTAFRRLLEHLLREDWQPATFRSYADVLTWASFADVILDC